MFQFKALSLLFVFTLVGCNSFISLTSLGLDGAGGAAPTPTPIPASSHTWNFKDNSLVASDFTFNSNHLYFDPNNGLSLKTVDTDFNSAGDFSRGMHAGTVFSGGKLSLSAAGTPVYELDAWSPKWSSIVGYWRMNETVSATVVTDYGASGLNGTASAVTFGGAGKLHEAAAFNGTSSYISLPSVASFGSLLAADTTVSFWFKSSDATHLMVAVGAESSATTTGYSIGFNQNQAGSLSSGSCRVLLRNSMGSAAYNVFSCAAFLDGNWHHLAAVSDGNSLAPIVYVDGSVRAPTSSSAGSAGSFVAMTSPLTVGALNSAGTRSLFFNGEIDELAVISDSWSATEVADIYDAQVATRTQDLSAAWTPKWNNIVMLLKMDNSWTDSSHLHSTVTPFGSPTFAAGKIGTNAGEFNGSSQYVTVPGNTDFDGIPHSVCTWISPTGVGADARIIEKGGYQIGGGFGLYYDARSIKYSQWVDASTECYVETDPYTVVLDQWTHVCTTYDGTTSKIYLNGEFYRSATCAQVPNTSGFVIGKDNPSLSFYEGLIDDLAVWNTPLNDNDVKTLYMRQRSLHSGYYESPVIDMGSSSAPWMNLTVRSTLPFGKELPGAVGNESSASYPSLVDNTGMTGAGSNLSDSLEALYHFSETGGTSLADASINGHTATANDPSVVGVDGVFGQGANLDSVTNHYIDTPSINLGNTFTFSVWANLDFTWGGFHTLLANAGAGNDSGFKLAVNTWGNHDGKVIFETGNGTTGLVAQTPNSMVLENKSWYHIAIVVDRAAGTADIYVNGQYANPSNRTVLTDFKISDVIRVGAMSDLLSYMNGKVDEVGIWKRTLTAEEIFELYRRGSNRIYYQVRSCPDSACNNVPWLGANTSGSVFYSELHNNASVNSSGKPTGNVALGFLNLDWSGSFFTASAKPVSQRYFQYRVYMESDDANNSCSGSMCSPELSSISIGPTSRYYGASPSITSNTAFSVTKLLGITNVDSNTCTKFQLSTDDGATWNYWNGSNWAAASTSAQSNLTTDITSHLSALTGGSFKFKAFLNTDAGLTQSCTLDSVSVSH